MPELDKKAASVFAGKVVRKDLVRKVKVGANVPVFVLEYLLGKYCATDDPAAIDAGLRVVNTTLSSNFVRPDEANKAQSMVKDKGKHTLIDKVQGPLPLRRRQALGRTEELRAQVRPHPRALPAGLRPAADGRHLGAGGHPAPVRRGGEGEAEPVLDRGPEADPARHVRPRRVPGVPPPVHDRGVDRPAAAHASAWSRRTSTGG